MQVVFCVFAKVFDTATLRQQYFSLSLHSSDSTTKSPPTFMDLNLWQGHRRRLEVGRSSDGEIAVGVGQTAASVI